MDGLIIADKPAGWTSHDLVLHLRKILRIKKIGHAGTLDPLATGVLLITLGQATRLFPYLSRVDKTYYGEIRLGLKTDTYDSQGQPLGAECRHLPELNKIEEAAASFLGETDQMPPFYSAKKINGEPAFKLIRKGVIPELKPVKVRIHRFLILEYSPPKLRFLVECSSGTYIRSLANDLGQKLGCGAYLDSLRRAAVGRYTEDEALSLEKIEELAIKKDLAGLIIPLDKLLPDYPAIWLDKLSSRLFLNGSRINIIQIAKAVLIGSKNLDEPVFRVFSEENRLLGLASFNPKEQFFKPELVFSPKV